MKQTPLKRKTPLRAKTVSSQRKPMKRSQPRRDWAAARAKVEAEGNVCRICGQGPAEAAHVIGREHDRLEERWIPGKGAPTAGITPTRMFFVVNPDHIIPLCRKHHTEYDAHSLDILPSLTREEEVEATRLVGLENARRRVCPSEYGNG